MSVEDHGIGIPKADQARDLRALLQGRQGAPPGWRDGARAVDRAARRRGPRRPDPGRVGRGPWLDLLVRPAGPRRGRGLRWIASTSPRSTSSTWPTAGTSGCRSCWPTSPRSSRISSGSRRSSTSSSRTGSSAAAGAAEYRAIRGWAGRPEYGNAMLVRAGLEASDPERLDLGLSRAAHRVVVGLPGGARVLFAVTHLHHEVPAAAERDRQAEALLGWLAVAPERRRPGRGRRLQRRSAGAGLRPDDSPPASARPITRRTAASRP